MFTMFVSTSSNKPNVSDLKLEIKIQITGGFYNFYPVYGVDLFSPNIGVWTPLTLSSSSSQSTLESRYNTCFIQFYHDYNLDTYFKIIDWYCLVYQSSLHPEYFHIFTVQLFYFNTNHYITYHSYTTFPHSHSFTSYSSSLQFHFKYTPSCYTDYTNLIAFLLDIDWNHLSHVVHGNIKKYFQRFSDILYQNIPGLKSIQDAQIALDVLMATKPALLAIAELPLAKLEQCHHPGYRLLPGKQQNSKKIRMNLLIKDGIEYEELDFTNEVPTVAIKLSNWSVVFVYREWRKCGDASTRHIDMQNDRWDTFVPKWRSLQGNGIVIGDMNHCFLNGNSTYQKQFHHIRDSIAENFLLEGWTQMVLDPTRHQARDSPSLLDHVYVTDCSYIERVYNSSLVDSDHNTVGTRLRHDGQVHHHKVIESRDIAGIDADDFEREFLISNLWEIFTEADVDTAVQKLNTKINRVLDLLAPVKSTVIRKNFAPWINDDIKIQLRERNKLHRIAQISGNQEDWTRYKKYRNKLRNLMRNTEEDYTKNWLNQDDVKTKWSRIRNMSGLDKTQSNHDVEIMTNFGKTKSGPVLSKFMNSYFKTKVELLKEKTNPNITHAMRYTRRYMMDKTHLFEDQFSFKNTDLDTLLKHTNNLSNTHSVGVDGISTLVVKRFKRCLLPSILHIVNLCITQSKYPSLWKCGLISPIPKKGDLSIPKNWRPIVLNTIISKLLERVLNVQIMTFMRANHIDPPTQHAYRSEKSCSTAWTELDSFIQKHRNQGRVVGVALTDQSAAFNVLEKDILVGRLKILGFSSEACKLISNYLTGRKTKCSMNGSTSDYVELSSGVGEGSVLGPTLYTLGQICVSTVCDIVKERMRNEYGIEVDTLSVEYADDVSGLVACDNDSQLQIAMNIIMDQYKDYFSACGLCLNADKCAILVIRSKARTVNIVWNGKPEEKKVKLLGIWLDSRYEFLDHVVHLVQVCSYKMSCIRKIAKWLTDDNLKDVVESLVISQITFCSEIYLRLKKVRKKVQKILNSAARLALRENRYANCEKMMDKLKWLNMDNMYLLQVLCSFRRLLGNGSSMLTYNFINWEARAGLRRRLIKLSWSNKTDNGKYCFIQTAVRTWNSMEVGKKLFPDKKSFRDWCSQELKRLHGNPNLH